MAKNPRKFGQLLTKAILRMKSLDQYKTIERIQRDLGLALGRNGGSAISYWRTGHIPAKQDDVEKLAREIIGGSGLERDWLEDFLKSAGYPNPAELCDQLCPVQPSDASLVSPSYLLGKSHKELVGRDDLLSDIMSVLQDPAAYHIATIDGMGGVGKSAIAREVAYRCLNDRLFDHVVWVSAAPGTESSPLTLEAILNAIGSQLKVHNLDTLTLEKKKNQILTLLRGKRVLLILDNLDTAQTPQGQIILELQPFLDYSRALLTSRHRFSGDIYPIHIYRIHLIGLDHNGSKRFILQEGSEKKIGRIKTINQDELSRIIETTGGSPLAMKLVVGQLEHLRLKTVLEHLSEVKPLRNNIDEDEYITFYKFIFLRSWDLLSENGKKLLLVMTHFPPEVGGKWDAIRTISHIDNSVLDKSIDELWRLSFLEVGEFPSVENVRYYLHTLTRNFVLSDIVRLQK